MFALSAGEDLGQHVHGGDVEEGAGAEQQTQPGGAGVGQGLPAALQKEMSQFCGRARATTVFYLQKRKPECFGSV